MHYELLSVDQEYSVLLPEEIINNSNTITNLVSDCNLNIVNKIPTSFSSVELIYFKKSFTKIKSRKVSSVLQIYDFLECPYYVYKVGKYIIKNRDQIKIKIKHIFVEHPKLLLFSILEGLIDFNDIPTRNLGITLSDSQVAQIINNYGIDNLKILESRLNLSFSHYVDLICEGCVLPLEIFSIPNNTLFTALIINNPKLIKRTYNALVLSITNNLAYFNNTYNVQLITKRLINYKILCPNAYSDEDLFNLSFKVPSSYILEQMDFNHIKGTRLIFGCELSQNLNQHIDYIADKGNAQLITRLITRLFNYNLHEEVIYLGLKYRHGKILRDIFNLLNMRDIIFIILLLLMLLFMNELIILTTLYLIIRFMSRHSYNDNLIMWYNFVSMLTIGITLFIDKLN